MSGHMFRTRFRQQIVAEFLPPSRPRKVQRLIILCDGMPSIPRKQTLSEFLAAKGFWVIYPRYRGAWESGGEFLEKSPHEDILDIIDDLPKGIEEIAFGQRFRLAPDQIFVIGGSFGGVAAILLSLGPRVKRVVANCPVVDWKILDRSEKVETSKENYAEYITRASSSPSTGKQYRLPSACGMRTYSAWVPSRVLPKIQPPCRQWEYIPRLQKSHFKQAVTHEMITLSPMWNSETPVPTCSMTPMPSWPRMRPSITDGRSPFRM